MKRRRKIEIQYPEQIPSYGDPIQYNSVYTFVKQGSSYVYPVSSDQQYSRDNYCMLPSAVTQMVLQAESLDLSTVSLPDVLNMFGLEYAPLTNAYADFNLTNRVALANSAFVPYVLQSGCSQGQECYGVGAIDKLTNSLSTLSSEWLANWGNTWDFSKNYNRPYVPWEESSSSGAPPSDMPFLCVVTQAPAGGYGAALVKKIVVNADGSWATTGPDIPVICPKLS